MNSEFASCFFSSKENYSLRSPGELESYNLDQIVEVNRTEGDICYFRGCGDTENRGQNKKQNYLII